MMAGKGMIAGRICWFVLYSVFSASHRKAAHMHQSVWGLSDDSGSSQYVYVYPVTLPKAISQI